MKRTCACLLALLFVGFSLFGCYHYAAKSQIKTTSGMLADMKARGGEKIVPYEYYSAETYLEGAQYELGENDHKDAKKLADRARAAAEQGLSLMKK